MESEDSSFRPMLLWGPQLSPRTGWVPSTQQQRSQVQGPGHGQPPAAPRCPAVRGSQGGGTIVFHQQEGLCFLLPGQQSLKRIQKKNKTG